MSVNSFSKACPKNAQLLILGSMPGVASLNATQYYAHPRNAFWPIMHALFGINSNDNYETRLQALNQQHIGLWDVLKSCEREGSLDSRIKIASETPNDLLTLIEQTPSLNAIAFNGGKAYKSFQRHFLKQHAPAFAHLQLFQLPSSSPAMASLSLEKKIRAWECLTTALSKP